MLFNVCPATRPTGIVLRGGYESDNEDDPKKLLAEIEQTQALINEGTTTESDEDNNPRRMLAELDSGTRSSYQAVVTDSPKMTLTDLDTCRKLPSKSLGDVEREDLDTLHSRLTTAHQPSRGLIVQEVSSATRKVLDHAPTPQDTTMQFTTSLTPYAIALLLENEGLGWEVAKSWSTYLFSAGLDSYKAQQRKHDIVDRASAELECTIQEVLKQEEHHFEVEKQQILPCRLIVSNLPVSVSEDDIRVFFHPYRFEM